MAAGLWAVSFPLLGLGIPAEVRADGALVERAASDLSMSLTEESTAKEKKENGQFVPMTIQPEIGARHLYQSEFGAFRCP